MVAARSSGLTGSPLKDRPPPPKPTPEGEARKLEVLGILTLNRMKSHTTTFTFDGNQSLSEALSYLSARQTLNIIVDERVRERCDTLKVRVSVRDVPVNEAMDELVRLDPDLLWEVQGNIVLVRGR